MSFGQTKLDAGDLVMPRVKLLQAQSEEAADGRGKPGEFWNTLTSELYGATLRFMPILPFKQRIFLVRAERREAIDDALVAGGLAELPDGTGLMCRSIDMIEGRGYPGIACDTCPLSKWDGQKPPLCSETYNVAAMTELGDLIILSFSKSSAKVGKSLFSMLRLSPRAAWSRVFEISARAEKGQLGNYQVPIIRPLTSEIPAPELLRQAETWARQLEGTVLDVTPVEEDEESYTPTQRARDAVPVGAADEDAPF
ncbi:MAG TPA: hypothetical protein VIV06_11860 [Candidatus Limnocylindrales bacterium]